MGNISSSIKEIIQKAKQKSYGRQEIEQLFFSEGYGHIKKVSIKGEKAFIYVDSAAAMYEYKLRREEIFNLINKIRKVKKVIFKLGS